MVVFSGWMLLKGVPGWLTGSLQESAPTGARSSPDTLSTLIKILMVLIAKEPSIVRLKTAAGLAIYLTS
jgi:hypothetical protein